MLIAIIALSIFVLILSYFAWSQIRINAMLIEKNKSQHIEAYDSQQKVNMSQQKVNMSQQKVNMSIMDSINRNSKSISDIYEQMAKGTEADIKILEHIEEMKREETAIGMLAAGIKPNWSTGIPGGMTAGYGKLDDNGFWQFELPNHIVKAIESKKSSVTESPDF